MLEAIKRVHGMRLIAPAWKDRQIKDRKFAAVARFEQSQRNSKYSQLPDITRRVSDADRLHLVK